MFSPVATILNLVVGVIELLLSLRLVFKFFNIGNASSFVHWLLNTTQPFVNPFVGIVPSFTLGRFEIESPAIIAILIIGLIGYFLSSLFRSPLDF